MADDLSTTIAEAARLLAGARDVTLLSHINPDADTLGSALAVGLALHRRGVTVRVAFGEPEGVPESLKALDTAGLLVHRDEVPEQPEFLVVMDTGSLQRLGPLAGRVAACTGPVIVVDHHVSNTRYGTVHCIDDHAEATALIALKLLDEMDVEIDEPIARCVYAGLVTDTGGFRKAGPEAHHTAARLLETGVDAYAVTRPLMDAHPFAYLGMLSRVLAKAELDQKAAHGLGLAHAVVSLDDARDVRSEEVESVIDVVRSASEAEVAAVLKELRPGFWSVSLRAVSRVDVREVAQILGGGGHRLAAGFTFDGAAEQVVAALKGALERVES
ncbi:bifunctional oligoribonuclease/PAP phosphatase NrnA [Lentzea sp. BCCO 10_0061]|uniref:Bifunctional oligoribonuclease/PAP phosphatase NrnA n=1 Tax=Lentzea sokolovensis TaxID=3095429 RepID=A0ABU4V0I3_9PSEU|nr:bifunctional oligoribonuclease/PAP phosphatase NrnA [Lentzea sp. BCCO 10_0061]MDX8145288.1 bifunctional oligoribonuclease/PAP phosphatase NrnA [Lentzea sp. BCCO 10_0061]